MGDRPSSPLSPHLQVYRLPLTPLLSITHRITGVVLSIGLLAVVGMLLAVAESPSAYEAIRGFLSGWIGRGLILIWLLALFVHFCHGVRHLIWDLGYGFERSDLTRHGVWEVAAAVALAFLTWLTMSFVP
ncbi:MAG: succinate dehydrogenase, cytochrome b556 subunit [Methylothermaceae bacterium]|nr:succinate dehydrogenase, cytochrome b556 subunit [Methylothermaceae bacterium]